MSSVQFDANGRTTDLAGANGAGAHAPPTETEWATPAAADEPWRGAFRLSSRVMCLAVGIIAATALTGTLLHWPVLSAWVVGLETMKLPTSVAFLFGAASLWFAPQPAGAGRTSARDAAVSRGGAAAAVLIGLLALIEKALMDVSGPAPILHALASERMALGTAVTLPLVGASLLLLGARSRRWIRLRELLAGTALVNGYLALLGYAYGVHALYRIEPYASMALPTAVSFALLGSGILAARPDQGLVAALSGDHAGGIAARRLLPVVVGLPAMLGWVRLGGERVGWYELEFGVALLVAATSIVLVAVVLKTARMLERVDAARQVADQALIESQARFARLVQSGIIGIIIADTQGRITDANRAFLDMVGYDVRDLPLRWDAMTPPEWRPSDERVIAELRRTGRATPWEKEYTRRDGTRVPVLIGVAQLDRRAEINVGFVLDLSERKRAEGEIRTLNAHLEERVAARTVALRASMRELEAFSYSVAHDLRTPLRAIAGFARILTDEYASQLADQPRRYLHIIRESAERMGHLIDDLLAFARLGRTPLKKERCAPESVVHEVLAELEPEIAGRTVDVQVARLPACDADPALLKQVWMNLLNNALKFTRGRKPAVIEIGCHNGGVPPEYFVRDNGVGFDMQYCHRLFRVFERLHRQQEYEGSGVGLALVQRIVERHGGRIRAEAAPGRGAIFLFTLEGTAADQGSHHD